MRTHMPGCLLLLQRCLAPTDLPGLRGLWKESSHFSSLPTLIKSGQIQRLKEFVDYRLIC